MKKQSRRKQRKDTEVSQLSGPTEPETDDTENMASIPTHSNDPLLSEKTKTSQAVEITGLKKRIKKLERKRKSNRPGMKRLFKIGRSAQVVSFEDEGLGDQEDASKQERKIADIDVDAEVTLVDEIRERNDKEMFDIGILDGEEVFTEWDMVEKEVSTPEVAIDSATTTTVDELTLAQTLIEIKAAKPKAVTTAVTKTTTAVTRPKARGVIVQELSEFTTTTSPSQPLQLPKAKDKCKAKIVEPEKPLKKKDQIMFDKEVAQKLQAQLDAELEEEESLQDKGKKMQTLLNGIIKKGVNTFVDMDTELVKGSKTKRKGSSKRAGEELESKNLKKQKLDENVETKVDNDQEEAEMKKHIEIVLDDEVAIDAIPLATKPPIIVDWKIIKEGKMGHFQIIRADGSLKRPEEAYERVLWGDLKVMFEPDIEISAAGIKVNAAGYNC
ncbi:hypothetical protein Tco_0377499 [Tanacetum coccineum]